MERISINNNLCERQDFPSPFDSNLGLKSETHGGPPSLRTSDTGENRRKDKRKDVYCGRFEGLLWLPWWKQLWTKLWVLSVYYTTGRELVWVSMPRFKSVGVWCVGGGSYGGLVAEV